MNENWKSIANSSGKYIEYNVLATKFHQKSKYFRNSYEYSGYDVRHSQVNNLHFYLIRMIQ